MLRKLSTTFFAGMMCLNTLNFKSLATLSSSEVVKNLPFPVYSYYCWVCGAVGLGVYERVSVYLYAEALYVCVCVCACVWKCV